ncbi:hypothetical protein CBS147347_3464 [Aspergillus niger]|nr:hypothetical protein CBS147347_3464 [Aspergillus niger]
MCSYAHLTRSLSRSHTFSTSIIAPLTRPPTTYAINYSQPHSYSTASHHQTQSLTMHLPSSQRICHDWMVVQGNVHYARDRAHFTTYRPVTAHLKNNIFNPMDELEVAGIGTVEIPVVRSLDNPFDTHTIVLENVLHIPEAVCNGFNPLLFGSNSRMADWQICCSSSYGSCAADTSLRVDFNFSTPDPHACGTSGRIPWYLRTLT